MTTHTISPVYPAIARQPAATIGENKSRQTAVSHLPAILSRYLPISLQEMNGVALLNRTDTKYVMAVDTLTAVLPDLVNDYRILQVAGSRQNHYQTLYFDTPDFALYHRHHAGALDRYKIRSRTYVESKLAVLEIKHKTNKRRTVKERWQTPEMITWVNQETAPFLQAHFPYDVSQLVPRLYNSFTRLTLVSKTRAERLTLDVNLEFEWGGRHFALPGIAIAEVKQEGFSPDSDFIRQIRAWGIRPSSFSKYCLGVSLLYPQVKHNNFKPQHLLIQKLTQGPHNDYHH